MRPDFDEIRTLTKRFALIPQKVAKFVFGVFRYADLSVLGDYKLRKAIKIRIQIWMIRFGSNHSDSNELIRIRIGFDSVCDSVCDSI